MLSATELGGRLDMSRSTIYRYLYTLRSYGLVEKVDYGDSFRLGPRVFQLARVARQGIGLIDVALPIMEALGATTKEVVLLTRRSGSLVTCIERVESSQPIRLSYERGQVLPIHAGASAKVLLAFESSDEIDRVLRSVRLERFTENTVTSVTKLKAQLNVIREQGYEVSVGEVDVGVCGVGAPIFGPTGRVIAAISVAGPQFRMGEAELPKIIPAVKEAAATISSRAAEVELNGSLGGSA